jgi:hypothetical protein
LLDAQIRIDLSTLEYQKPLRENWIKGLDKRKEPVFYNCYSVRPVRKSSLIVNQFLKRICFSDITTYHSPPYDYTSTNKDPSRLLVIRAIRGKTQYNIFKRQQAKEFFFLKELPQKRTQWSKFKVRRSERNWTYKKNLQGPYILRNGRDGNIHFFQGLLPSGFSGRTKELRHYCVFFIRSQLKYLIM